MNIFTPNARQPDPSNRAFWLAFVCTLAWFALWLSAFRPVLELPVEPARYPTAAFCPAANEPLQSPTLFALPSEQGFSGVFPARSVNVTLSLERPPQPQTYLARQPTAAPAPDQTQLIESIPLPQNKLLAPGATRTVVIRQPEPIILFFSPNLQPRVNETTFPNEIKSLPAASVRIHLNVRPDGSIAHAFFESPVDSSTLLSAVRKLRFTPTDEETAGWLDIRYTPPQENLSNDR